MMDTISSSLFSFFRITPRGTYRKLDFMIHVHGLTNCNLQLLKCLPLQQSTHGECELGYKTESERMHGGETQAFLKQ